MIVVLSTDCRFVSDEGKVCFSTKLCRVDQPCWVFRDDRAPGRSVHDESVVFCSTNGCREDRRRRWLWLSIGDAVWQGVSLGDSRGGCHSRSRRVSRGPSLSPSESGVCVQIGVFSVDSLRKSIQGLHIEATTQEIAEEICRRKGTRKRTRRSKRNEWYLGMPSGEMRERELVGGE